MFISNCPILRFGRLTELFLVPNMAEESKGTGNHWFAGGYPNNCKNHPRCPLRPFRKWVYLFCQHCWTIDEHCSN